MGIASVTDQPPASAPAGVSGSAIRAEAAFKAATAVAFGYCGEPTAREWRRTVSHELRQSEHRGAREVETGACAHSLAL
eukprot:SAG11_NODE_6147_length_1377_cov_1.378717_2_plen_79_part_00